MSLAIPTLSCQKLAPDFAAVVALYVWGCQIYRAQGLFLNLCSGIISGGAQAHAVGPGTDLDSAVCEAGTLPAVLAQGQVP